MCATVRPHNARRGARPLARGFEVHDDGCVMNYVDESDLAALEAALAALARRLDDLAQAAAKSDEAALGGVEGPAFARQAAAVRLALVRTDDGERRD